MAREVRAEDDASDARRAVAPWAFDPALVEAEPTPSPTDASAGLVRARAHDDFVTVEGRCRPYACLEAAALERRNVVGGAALAANVAVGAGVLALAAGVYALTVGRRDPLGTVGALLASGGTATF